MRMEVKPVPHRPRSAALQHPIRHSPSLYSACNPFFKHTIPITPDTTHYPSSPAPPLLPPPPTFTSLTRCLSHTLVSSSCLCVFQGCYSPVMLQWRCTLEHVRALFSPRHVPIAVSELHTYLDILLQRLSTTGAFCLTVLTIGRRRTMLAVVRPWLPPGLVRQNRL